MPGWVGDIERETLDNETFRTVVFTGEHTQLTVMSIAVGDDIGGEVHEGHDQFIRIESGSARVELGGSEGAPEETHDVEDDWAVIVPAGCWHNVVNTGSDELKVRTRCIRHRSIRTGPCTPRRRTPRPQSTSVVSVRLRGIPDRGTRWHQLRRK